MLTIVRGGPKVACLGREKLRSGLLIDEGAAGVAPSVRNVGIRTTIDQCAKDGGRVAEKGQVQGGEAANGHRVGVAAGFQQKVNGLDTAGKHRAVKGLPPSPRRLGGIGEGSVPKSKAEAVDTTMCGTVVNYAEAVAISAVDIGTASNQGIECIRVDLATREQSPHDWRAPPDVPSVSVGTVAVKQHDEMGASIEYSPVQKRIAVRRQSRGIGPAQQKGMHQALSAVLYGSPEWRATIFV